MLNKAGKKLAGSDAALGGRLIFDAVARSVLFSITLCFSFFAGCGFPASVADSAAAAEAKKAKNEAALEQAERNIEKYRQGEAEIKIIDRRGKPVKNAKVKIRQKSHEFKFGCYLKIDDLAPEKLPAYEQHFARLFNFAVIGTYWDFVETKRGKQNWEWFEKEAALARKLNLKIQAAPLLWGTNKSGTPDWLPRSKEALLPILQKHVRSTLAKYETAVDEWEIVNEPLAPKPDLFAQTAGEEYVAAAFGWARSASSATGRLLINEYGVFGSLPEHNFARESYFALLVSLLEKGVPIDVVGLQAHANGEWYEPSNVAEMLERYARLGKPLQITEFSAQTLNYNDRKTPLKITGTYQSGTWNNQKQAEFYREFYTIAFGHPQVEAIVTWGLDDERAWLPGIGLIDVEGQPKPVYEALDQLINHRWRTNLQADLSERGDFRFRGFYGVYEVQLSDGEKTLSKKFELKKGVRNEWIVRF